MKGALAPQALPKMRILFITHTNLGDAIISTGILRYLQLSHPNSHITVACGPVAAQVFDDFPGTVHILTKKPYAGHWRTLYRHIYRYKWDYVVDLRGTLLSYGLRCRNRYIWKSSPTNVRRVDQLARLIGIKETPPSYIWLNPSRHTDTPPLLVIGATANWAFKKWPISHFVTLIKKLLHGPLKEAHILLPCAPNEREQLNPLLEQLPKERLWPSPQNLLDLAGTMINGQLFVGNDSGLMHLAAALNIPTLGLFGPSRSDVYAPWGAQAHFIRAPLSYDTMMKKAIQGEHTMHTLSAHKVYDACSSILASL